MLKNIFLLKIIFYISIIFLIVLSLYPGSLLGYFLYGDIYNQPDIIKTSLGTSINHIIYYLYITTLGLFVYSDKKKFLITLIFLIFLSIILEIIQIYIPVRTFEIIDLICNFFGVLLGLVIVLLINKWN